MDTALSLSLSINAPPIRANALSVENIMPVRMGVRLFCENICNVYPMPHETTPPYSIGMPALFMALSVGSSKIRL